MSLGLMKAGSDLCLTLPPGVASSASGSTELSLDETDDGVNMKVILVSSADMMMYVMDDCCLVDQRSWL